MDTLKPCPFCGGGAEVRADSVIDYCVVCVNVECFCAVGEGYGMDGCPEHSFESREEAIKAWNTRIGKDNEDK